MGFSESLFQGFGGAKFEPVPGEVVLHQGPANCWRGIEAVGGYLWLTDRRLVFRSHKFNAQSGEQSWERGGITACERVRTLGIIPNGIRIHLRDGGKVRFVVQGARTWHGLLSV